MQVIVGIMAANTRTATRCARSMGAYTKDRATGQTIQKIARRACIFTVTLATERGRTGPAQQEDSGATMPWMARPVVG